MRRTLCTTLVGLALALAACGGDDDENGGGGESANTNTSENTEQQAGNRYPDQIRENFMNSCEQSSNGQTAVCECSLEKIEEQYSLDEFKEIDEKQREEGGALPAEMQQIVEECVREEG
ncbi:MAG TPA: hypothetical protein VHF89_10815 [Solirubrobacteraceae bacterium]|nr:hypothetical protein [Solirubrobacteraceae bacterium]